ncbi:MAG: hypothetical protein WKF55_04335 [Gemmatimonadaceae bacterium]
MQASSGPAQATPAPSSGRATVTVTNADGTSQTLAIPLTKQGVADLRARREELSNQQQSSAGRRRRLSQELRAQPEGAPRAGIEGQLAVLDTRLMQLETDIAATGRQLSAAPLATVSGAGPLPGNDIPENVAALSGAFTVFVLFPIALAYARRIWKGSSRTPLQTSFPPESAQRLERLEQGMESIAIEIERVAEGQRFVTRLLSEAAPVGKIGSISHQAEAHRT